MNIEEYSRISPHYYSDDIPELLKKYLSNFHYSHLLDCGCGDGSLLNTLFKNGYLTNKKVYAIDLSTNRIDLVKKISKYISAAVDNAEVMKTIKDDSIDFFVSVQVMEHVDDQKMINSICRVTKRNGLIYISTVFKKWYGWYFYRNNGKWVLDPTHVREYEDDHQLLDLFSRKKFQLLESKKTLQKFPLMDFFVKRLGINNRYFYENRFLKLLRNIKTPIFGYYAWEVVFRKI